MGKQWVVTGVTGMTGSQGCCSVVERFREGVAGRSSLTASRAGDLPGHAVTLVARYSPAVTSAPLPVICYIRDTVPF